MDWRPRKANGGIKLQIEIVTLYYSRAASKAIRHVQTPLSAACFISASTSSVRFYSWNITTPDMFIFQTSQIYVLTARELARVCATRLCTSKFECLITVILARDSQINGKLTAPQCFVRHPIYHGHCKLYLIRSEF